MTAYFVPDYHSQCLVCEESPTVTVVEDGKIVSSPGLCGPCTFGTAQALDPSQWNELD